MKRRHITWLVGIIALLAFGGVVVYQFSGGRQYSTDINALRAQFNKDKGTVRLLVLLAPT
ncbi:MAG: hypothetical protein ABIO91_02435 [Pyrinomonadaceae bacterium]